MKLVKDQNSPDFLKSRKNKWQFFEIHCQQTKKRLTCSKCQDILIQPRQTKCGCRLCYECMRDMLENREPWCPGCKETIDITKCYSLPDKAVEKEIFDLRISCKYNNCRLVFKLRELLDHLNVCEYREETCDKCNELYVYKTREEHLIMHCKMLKTNCSDCGKEMTKRHYEEIHRNVNSSITTLCDNWKDMCPYKCTEKVQDNIKEHLNSCAYVPVECVMKVIGCNKSIRRCDMDEHMMNELCYHTTLIGEQIMDLKKDSVEMEVTISENVIESNGKLASITELVTELSKQVEILTHQVDQSEKMLLEVENKVNTLKGSSTCERQLLSNEIHGEYTWKIENIAKLIIGAKKGFNLSMISEPFYSGNPGYKICLKIYPNGDGTGFGKYLSIYFVLTKGKYDDEIQWPYDRKISLSLMTSRGNGQHKTAIMKPDSNEKCYGKPTSFYNLAAGIPTFISHSELLNNDGFLENGVITVFAKVAQV